jgi:hypothetical protein
MRAEMAVQRGNDLARRAGGQPRVAVRLKDREPPLGQARNTDLFGVN